MSGDTKTGVSIMKIEEKLDRGPVLKIKELDLDRNSTYGETEKKLSIRFPLFLSCLCFCKAFTALLEK